MIPVYDKPTIQKVVEAVASGIQDRIIVLGKNNKSIEEHFDKPSELEYRIQKAGKDHDLKQIRKIICPADIYYVRQKNQKGLGDSITK
ncbi:hypothetical protein [Methanobrevibacter sp. UBA212]|uniref:hypothetical protein n=1 Tax=Methanobrevibacter sp. UBA212 TaxID=1915476 RepID=UPI0025D7AA0E|nr:hypothetical protein [Methanobrevibacter sp. UBA212]